MAETKVEYRSGEAQEGNNARGGRRRRGERAVRDLTSTSLDLTREATRLARAWSEANAEVMIGTTRVVGGLLGGLTDALTRGYRPDDYDDYDDYDDDSDDAQDAADTRSRRDSRGMRGSTRDVTRTLSSAIRESARVAQRSVDRFARTYEGPGSNSDEDTSARED